MRVLQVMGRSAGGMARHVAQVTEALDGRNGMTIDIACPADVPLDMPKEPIPLFIPRGPIVGHKQAVARIAQLLDSYDVVHSHGLRAGIDAGLAARRAGVRSFVTVHNLVQPEIAGKFRVSFYKRAEAAAVWANDHTFAVSQDIARHLRGMWPRRAADIEVLYLGIGDAPTLRADRIEMRTSLGLEPESALIVSVSRLVPQKSLGTLLRAMTHLQTDANLVVVGEGRLREQLETEMRALGLQDRVHFLGFRRDVADWVAAADVFTLSSIWEGVPLAAQEAVLLRTPVVATDVGGLRELISNKVSGRLCPPRDPVALARAIDEVLTDKERARAYSEAALASLEQRFSTKVMLERLAEAYRG